MPHYAYPKYASMSLGPYSVPRWFGLLQQLLDEGQASYADIADAQLRATQAALIDMGAAGLDIVTSGEMHRRVNNRNAPFDAMINYFARMIPAFSDELKSRSFFPGKDEIRCLVPTCRDAVGHDSNLGLVQEFEIASGFTNRDVKITMTGPHMLAHAVWDEHYGDRDALMVDLAKLMNVNFKRLARVGCKILQLDEWLMGSSSQMELPGAVEAINIAIEGVELSVQVHLCQGSYTEHDAYEGMLGHHHGHDPVAGFAALVSDIDCDVISAEHDMAKYFEGYLGDKYLALGAADMQSLDIELPEEIAERIGQYGWLAPEQTLLTTSCGVNFMPRQIAFEKLKAIALARHILM